MRTDNWLSQQYRQERDAYGHYRPYVVPRDGENGPELFIQHRAGTDAIPLTSADLWRLLEYAAQTLRRQTRKAPKVQTGAGADD